MRPLTSIANACKAKAYVAFLGLALCFSSALFSQDAGSDTPIKEPAKQPADDEKPVAEKPETVSDNDPKKEPESEKAPEKPMADQKPDPLTEARKKLNDTTPADQRRKAIEEIIRLRGEEPATSLISIIENRLPRRPFEDLLSLMQDQDGGKYRRAEFFPPLARAMMDDPEQRKAITDILTMSSESMKTLACAKQLLSSPTLRDVIAGCQVARLRPQGTRGDVPLIRLMIPHLADADETLKTQLLDTLRTLSHQDFAGNKDAWTAWLIGKNDFELASEIADAASAKLKEAEARNRKLQDDLVRTVVERMQRDEKDNVEALTNHLTKNPNASVRLKAAELLANLIPSLQSAKRNDAMTALASRFVKDTETDEQVLLASARALAKVKEHALEHVAQAIRTNGVSKAVKLELVRALGSVQALQVIAEFLNSFPQYGDPVQLALIKQVTVAIGASPEAANAALAPIYTRFGERLIQTVGEEDNDAWQREADAILNALNYLSQPIVGLDISPTIPVLCTYATGGIDRQARTFNLLRQAVAAKPAHQDALRKEAALLPMLLEVFRAEAPEADHLLSSLRLVTALSLNEPTLVAEVAKHLRQHAVLTKPSDLAEVVRALIATELPTTLAQELVDADDQEILRQATQLAIAEAGEGKLIALAEALVPEAADDSIIARDRIQSLIRPRVQSPALSARFVKAAGLVTTMMIEWIDTCFTNAEGGDAPSDDSKASLLEIAKGERANMLLNKTVELLGKEATNSPRRKVLVDVANASLQSIEATKGKGLALASDSADFVGDLGKLRTQLKELDVISGK